MLKRFKYLAALGFILALLLPATALAGADFTYTVDKATTEPGSPGLVTVTDTSTGGDPDPLIEINCDYVGPFNADYTITAGNSVVCQYPQAGEYYIEMHRTDNGFMTNRISDRIRITPGDEQPEGISLISSSSVALPGELVLASPKPNLTFGCDECSDVTVKRSGPFADGYHFSIHIDVAALGTQTGVVLAWRNNPQFAERGDVSFTVTKNAIDPFKLVERKWLFTRQSGKCLVEDYASFYQTESAMVTQKWSAVVGVKDRKKRKTDSDSYFGAYYVQETQLGLALSAKGLPAVIKSTTVIGSEYKQTKKLRLTPRKFKKQCGK